MKSLVLSQPMLLPWLGMFEQAALCDLFIFHDDIPLPRSHGKAKSFQTRVQIKTPAGWDWLSLPVSKKNAAPDLPINEARFVDQAWRKQHLVEIRKSYKTAPHFREIYEGLVEPIYAFETEMVAEFCIEGMLRLFRQFGLAPEIHRTSALGLPRELVASPRVLEHCVRLKADRYITGLGALEYIDYDLFERAGVQIWYMEYAKKPYPQLHGPFNPYVTVLDLLFNVGGDFRGYFASGMRYWKEIDDVTPKTYRRK